MEKTQKSTHNQKTKQRQRINLDAKDEAVLQNQINFTVLFKMHSYLFRTDAMRFRVTQLIGVVRINNNYRVLYCINYFYSKFVLFFFIKISKTK